MKLRKNEGQALVEFALIVPILLLLIFGAIEFGRVFHVYHVITSAAREGARAAALGDSDDEIRNKIAAAVSTLVGDSDVEINSSSPGEGKVYLEIYRDAPNEDVEIIVKGAVKIIVPLISAILPENPLIINSKAHMRMEYLTTNSS